jgi:uncharacterized protein
MHIIDRRLNPRGKSLENRQRFLRRAKAHLRQAVREVTQSGAIRDVLEGGPVAIPIDGIEEPRFHSGSGGIRDHVLPGNRKFIEGDVLPRVRMEAAASRRRPAKATETTCSASS